MKPSDLAAKVGSDEGLPPRQREDPQRATPFKARHWIDGCGVCCALAYSVLALQPTRIPLTLYFAALALAWVASLVAFAMLRGADGAFPLRRMLIWCLLFRAIGLTSEPVLEDDHYRYLWDGRTFAVEGSPYLGAPIDHFDNRDIPERFDHILDRINHPDLPTVYPLVAQATFLVGYWIAPGELAPIKLLLLLADLATLALLLRMIAPRKALLYAWCPLLIQETAFSGHIDSLGVLFLVAGFVAFANGRDVLLGLALALAVATKPFALIVAPLFILGRGRAEGLRTAAVFIPCVGILYAPLLLSGEAGLHGLVAFAGDWEFNSTFFALLANLFGGTAAKLLGAAAVAIVCGGLLVGANGRWASCATLSVARGVSSVPRGDVLLGCFFLVAPVVNPWYLLWLLPFVCVYPSYWGIAGLCGVSLSYAHGLFLSPVALEPGGLPPYHHPEWVRPMELFLVALGVILQSHRSRSQHPMRSHDIGSPIAV